MTTPDPVRRLLDRVEPPAPPAELETRSLAAARTAMARTSTRTDLWTRMWESRTARLAWAAAVAGLVLGHVALSLPNRPTQLCAGCPHTSSFMAVRASGARGAGDIVCDFPLLLFTTSMDCLMFRHLVVK